MDGWGFGDGLEVFSTCPQSRGTAGPGNVQGAERIGPLVAVQPVYMHPYTAAKMVASIAHMYERRLFINMLAGGFRNDLLALGDETPHDERYARTTEYALVMKWLLEQDGPVTLE